MIESLAPPGERVSALGEYVTLEHATQVCDLSYWAMRRFVRAHPAIACLRIGHSVLVPLTHVLRAVENARRRNHAQRLLSDQANKLKRKHQL